MATRHAPLPPHVCQVARSPNCLQSTYARGRLPSRRGTLFRADLPAQSLAQRNRLMRQLLSACALTGALAQAVIAHAQIISSFPADFSSTVNTDTSMWSYRYRPDQIRNGDYFLLPTYFQSLGTWTPTNPNSWHTSGSGLPE